MLLTLRSYGTYNRNFCEIFQTVLIIETVRIIIPSISLRLYGTYNRVIFDKRLENTYNWEKIKKTKSLSIQYSPFSKKQCTFRAKNIFAKY